MFELTEGRRDSVRTFLTNAGTVALAGLVVGSLAREGRFQLPLFVSGCTIDVGTLVGCWLLDSPEKEG